MATNPTSPGLFFGQFLHRDMPGAIKFNPFGIFWGSIDRLRVNYKNWGVVSKLYLFPPLVILKVTATLESGRKPVFQGTFGFFGHWNLALICNLSFDH